MYARYSAESEMLSAMMSFAPCSASSAFFTCFPSSVSSPVTYFFASSKTGASAVCASMYSASPSSPFSLAMLALVFLLGRYGRYKSSTTTSVSAARICFFNSSVSFPCSSMLPSTCSFFSSRLRRYSSLSCRFRSCSSFKEPVASFR